MSDHYVNKGFVKKNVSESSKRTWRDHLYRANEFLISEVAMEYRDYGLTKVRLINLAHKGFEKAVEEYDIESSQPFFMFARSNMKHEITLAILKQHDL